MARYSTPQKKRPVLTFFLIFVLLVITAIIAGIYWLNGEVSGNSRAPGTITVDIPKGASTTVIASVLEENGAIGNALVFRAYCKYVDDGEGDFQYGSFELEPSKGYSDIITALRSSVQLVDTVTVTFPEGYNAFQMGEALENAGLCTQKEFLEAVNSHSFAVSFMDQVSNSENKLVRLDGFLFPDTYQFFADEGVDSIILRMLNNFQSKALTEEYQLLMADRGFTLEQWVTFASIIQKEAANVEEMYNVSSVFNNRMQPESAYPQLESCTTNNYINDYMRPYFDGNAPQNMLTAYDTYGMVGLPVGAIANPGLDALDAALRPNDTPYYFFVTDIEFTHYYGKNWQEHLNNIEKAKAVNRTYGKEGL